LQAGVAKDEHQCAEANRIHLPGPSVVVRISFTGGEDFVASLPPVKGRVGTCSTLGKRSLLAGFSSIHRSTSVPLQSGRRSATAPAFFFDAIAPSFQVARNWVRESTLNSLR
jgi:hypothetical protein